MWSGGWSSCTDRDGHGRRASINTDRLMLWNVRQHHQPVRISSDRPFFKFCALISSFDQYFRRSSFPAENPERTGMVMTRLTRTPSKRNRFAARSRYVYEPRMLGCSVGGGPRQNVAAAMLPLLRSRQVDNNTRQLCAAHPKRLKVMASHALVLMRLHVFPVRLYIILSLIQRSRPQYSRRMSCLLLFAASY